MTSCVLLAQVNGIRELPRALARFPGCSTTGSPSVCRCDGRFREQHRRRSTPTLSASDGPVMGRLHFVAARRPHEGRGQGVSRQQVRAATGRDHPAHLAQVHLYGMAQMSCPCAGALYDRRKPAAGQCLVHAATSLTVAARGNMKRCRCCRSCALAASSTGAAKISGGRLRRSRRQSPGAHPTLRRKALEKWA